MVNRTFPKFPKRQELPGHIGRYGVFCLDAARAKNVKPLK
jgi:hypothetical protein